MKSVRVFGSLDLRVQEVLGSYIPDIQRNVIARVPDGDTSMVLSDNYLITDIRDLASEKAFMQCYQAGEVAVVDEAVAACQQIVIGAAQRQYELLSRDIGSVASFLSGLGHSCVTAPSVGFSDHTADGSILQLKCVADIESLRSKPFSEASVRNWIDMIVGARTSSKGAD